MFKKLSRIWAGSRRQTRDKNEVGESKNKVGADKNKVDGDRSKAGENKNEASGDKNGFGTTGGNKELQVGERADKTRFGKNLESNIRIMRERLAKCSDVVYREVSIACQRAYLVYNEGLIDKAALNEHILELCFTEFRENTAGLYQRLKNRGIAIGEVKSSYQVEVCLDYILKGWAALLLEGHEDVLLWDIVNWEKRPIERPNTEPSIRGPKDSFIEILDVNVSLLRRRLPTPDFKMIDMILGQKSKTKVIVCYLESIASSRLVEEVLRRLEAINIDALLSSGDIEELIEDEPYSLFPTIQVTERPDTAVSSMLEGRVVIMQENSPFALILPAMLMQFFQSVDDYYNRYFYGTFIRMARLVALFITVYLPSLYVAVTTFHQEMLPISFLIGLQLQREGIPFPAILEATLMGFAFEILREAGLRLPRAVGQAVSIVGALIIGEAAVSAGLVAPAMVIVTAATAIASFTIPSMGINEPLIPIRLIMVILSGMLGLWGVLIFTLVLLGHLASLRSFGVPYLAPAAPLVKEDLDDFIARAPLWQMKKRPALIAGKNLIRQGRRPPATPAGSAGERQ